MYYVDLDAARGREANTLRPAVLVSSDGLNRTVMRLGRGVVTVVPITSNVASVHPFQVLLEPEDSGLEVRSKAQAEQIRTLDVDRIGACVGTLGPAVLAELDRALRVHLSL